MNGWVSSPIVGSDGVACNVAVTIGEIGRGAERIVYELKHYIQNANNGAIITVGDSLVAKESLYLEDDALKMDFHYIFCKTQQQAAHFARRFNERVSSAFDQRHWIVPATISFLSCYVYELYGQNEHEYFNVLIEKMLDRRKWTKWNTNAGKVLGEAAAAQDCEPAFLAGEGTLEADQAAAVPFILPAIAEGSDSEGEVEGSDSEEEADEQLPSRLGAARQVPQHQSFVSVADFPQVSGLWMWVGDF